MKSLFIVSIIAVIAWGAENIVQIFPTTSSDIQALDQLNLPIYAQMENSYIGLLSSSQILLLEQSKINYKTICLAPHDGDFYIVTPPAAADLNYSAAIISNYARILFEHAGVFFAVGEPQMIEYLPSLRFHITRVNRRPIVLAQKFLPYPINSKYNPVVKWVIDQITPGELSRFVRDLSGENPVTVGGRTDTIRSRYTNNQKNSVALKYYYEKMQSFGVDSIIYHRFSSDSNVIATRIGRVYPKQQYLIGGHIDDVPSSGNAPGADDNATGTIAGLIAAKYIRGIPFKRTIKFVAWNAEEQGLIGSDYYASEAAARGDSIRGYLNGDMLAYESSNMDYIWCYNANRPGSIVISTKFTQMNTDYSLGLRVRISTSMPSWSDMYSFWINGFEAICNIENDNNPYYHTVNDRINTLDTIYYCKVVKCMVATLLELAEPDTAFQDVGEENQLSLSSSVFSVKPNPSRGDVQFVVIDPRFEKGILRIYGIAGKLIKAIDQPIFANRSYRLKLASGVYFAKYNTDNSSVTKKFVIMN